MTLTVLSLGAGVQSTTLAAPRIAASWTCS
jgi:hypothetical protein